MICQLTDVRKKSYAISQQNKTTPSLHHQSQENSNHHKFITGGGQYRMQMSFNNKVRPTTV
jgi:hypothetical protein